MLMFMVHVTTKDHIGIYALCSHLILCWCPYSILPPEAMWMFTVYAVTRNNVEVRDPAAAFGFYEQEAFFCSSINDCKLIIENNRK